MLDRIPNGIVGGRGITNWNAAGVSGYQATAFGREHSNWSQASHNIKLCPCVVICYITWNKIESQTHGIEETICKTRI